MALLIVHYIPLVNIYDLYSHTIIYMCVSTYLYFAKYLPLYFLSHKLQAKLRILMQMPTNLAMAFISTTCVARVVYWKTTGTCDSYPCSYLQMN